MLADEVKVSCMCMKLGTGVFACGERLALDEVRELVLVHKVTT